MGGPSRKPGVKAPTKGAVPLTHAAIPKFKSGDSIQGLLHKRSTAEDAHYHTVGLCLSRLMDQLSEGSNSGPGSRYTAQYMGDLVADPKLLGTVTLTLLGMVRRLADAREPSGFALMVTHLTDAMVEDG